MHVRGWVDGCVCVCMRMHVRACACTCVDVYACVCMCMHGEDGWCGWMVCMEGEHLLECEVCLHMHAHLLECEVCMGGGDEDAVPGLPPLLDETVHVA